VRADLSGPTVDVPIARAADALFAGQRPDGSWPNQRPPAVLGTAGALTALHIADGRRSGDLVECAVGWLVRAQNADGGWGAVAGTRTQLVPTLVAASALRIAARDAAAEPVRRALLAVDALGGVPALTDPGMVHLTSMFLGLAGLAEPPRAPRIPGELLALPPRVWRRQLSFRVVPFAALALVQAGNRSGAHPPGLRDRLARRASLRVLAQVERRENSRGGYGGDNWLTAVTCLALVRTGASGQDVGATVDYLRANARSDGSWHIMQGLDVIGGAYVARGLADAGYGRDARLVRARRWLRSCQQKEPFPVYGAAAGGWGWEGPRGWPNALDTTIVLAALAAGEDDEPGAPLARGLDWLSGRQDRAGSWSTFVTDTTLSNDGPCPYATARAVTAMLDVGTRPDDPRMVRALDWVLRNQQPDGTWPAVWYRGPVAGTATVLTALSRAGAGRLPAADAAARALLRAQLPDGTWGAGHEPSGTADGGNVEETAWALDALLHHGLPPDDDRVVRAVEAILGRQQEDGRWPASPVCTYVRGVAHYVDGLVVDGLCLSALGRYRAACRAGAGQERPPAGTAS
jgi:squalene-hopene/tetraprenyl-beta-curcumene cyclase